MITTHYILNTVLSMITTQCILNTVLSILHGLFHLILITMGGRYICKYFL